MKVMITDEMTNQVSGGKFVDSNYAKECNRYFVLYINYLEHDCKLDSSKFFEQTRKASILYQEWEADNNYHTNGEYGQAIFNLPIDD